MRLVLILSLVILSMGVKINKTDAAVKFTEGLIQGAFHDNVYVKDCLSDAEVIYTDLTLIASEYKKPNGTEKAIVQLSKTLQDVQNAYSECDNAEKYMEMIEAVKQDFANPWDLVEIVGKSITFHGVEIFGDINRITASYAAGNWFNVGRNVGVLMATIFDVQNKTVTY